jgi:hypothetical protein
VEFRALAGAYILTQATHNLGEGTPRRGRPISALGKRLMKALGSPRVQNLTKALHSAVNRFCGLRHGLGHHFNPLVSYHEASGAIVKSFNAVGFLVGHQSVNNQVLNHPSG